MVAETQNSLDRNQPRVIFIKKEFLAHIESGAKTCELRIAYKIFKNIKPGQIIEFRSFKENQSVKVAVVDIRQYPDLGSILENEQVDKIDPEVPSEQIPVIFAEVFNEDDVKRYGLVIIEFKKIEEYNEKKLEEEMTESYGRSEKYYEEQLARSDLEPGQRYGLEQAKSQLELSKNNPAESFISFANNFFSKFPGGRQWAGAEFSKQEQEEQLKGAQLEQWAIDELKIHNDMMEILKDLSARPEFVMQISNVRKMRNIDPEAYDLMKKVYIGMRNKGHTHGSLYS